MNWIQAALVIIDVQKAIDADYWHKQGARNNPEAEQVIARLLEYWRSRHWPIVHVRHSSHSPESAYHARSPGFAFKLKVQTGVKELVVTKRENSGFVNTSLHAELKQLRCDKLVICGVTTNHSVDATVRHARALGYAVRLVTDGCAAFPLALPSGDMVSAQQVHDIFCANLACEYAELVTSDQLMA
ncbi:isochorismatase family protein [Simiduia agarivorans]|uniref:isochorismatase family protein n=1 Tax=Simiduia agarivorans TaxID=447471 RepID=UPI000462B450|nr:isochorismatase family protein [Simiduia agarivorans]